MLTVLWLFWVMWSFHNMPRLFNSLCQMEPSGPVKFWKSQRQKLLSKFLKELLALMQRTQFANSLATFWELQSQKTCLVVFSTDLASQLTRVHQFWPKISWTSTDSQSIHGHVFIQVTIHFKSNVNLLSDFRGNDSNRYFCYWCYEQYCSWSKDSNFLSCWFAT